MGNGFCFVIQLILYEKLYLYLMNYAYRIVTLQYFFLKDKLIKLGMEEACCKEDWLYSQILPVKIQIERV